MLLAAAERFTTPGAPPGCLIVLGAPSGADTDAGVGVFLGDNRREMQGRILARLTAGAAAGELPAGADLKGLAAFYTTIPVSYTHLDSWAGKGWRCPRRPWPGPRC